MKSKLEIANYPFSYFDNTDPNGMFIGNDVNGSNIIVEAATVRIQQINT